MVLGQSAPRVRTLNYILEKYNNIYKTDIEPIGNPAVIDQIFKSDILAEIAYTLAVPSSEVLGDDVIGLNKKQVAELKNANTKRVNVVLKPESRGILARGRKVVKNIVKPFVEERDKYDKVKIRAKELNGYMQDYDLLDSYCTYKININQKSNYDRTRLKNEFYDKLMSAYQEREQILKSFTGRLD